MVGVDSYRIRHIRTLVGLSDPSDPPSDSSTNSLACCHIARSAVVLAEREIRHTHPHHRGNASSGLPDSLSSMKSDPRLISGELDSEVDRVSVQLRKLLIHAKTLALRNQQSINQL